MATIGGAHVLGLADEIGSLAPGKRADVIMVDLMQPHLQPFYSPDILVYAGSGADVRDVIINGRLAMQDRKILTFDVEETMTRVQELAEKLVSEKEQVC
jgi:5-methylthioadenosine/S-adenosylhomocysteine deaminase